MQDAAKQQERKRYQNQLVGRVARDLSNSRDATRIHETFRRCVEWEGRVTDGVGRVRYVQGCKCNCRGARRSWTLPLRDPMFRRFDVNKDGHISKEEFAFIMVRCSRLGVWLSLGARRPYFFWRELSPS